MQSASLHVALVYPDIHWNTGNIGRSCLAFEAHLHLVAPLGFSLDDKQVRRAGLDYWQHVQYTLHPNWDTLAVSLDQLGEPWFLSVEGTRDLSSIRFQEKTIFVLGSETEGLPQAIREEHRKRLVRIPQQRNRVRSLNLSTAAALCLYAYRVQHPFL